MTPLGWLDHKTSTQTKSDWLKIWNGRGILIYSAGQGIIFIRTPIYRGCPFTSTISTHHTDVDILKDYHYSTSSKFIGYTLSLTISLLTLKAPRKTASENVVCLCRLLNILANFIKPTFAYRQTVWTQIRLLLKKQSDLGPHCLQKWLLKSQADEKADDNSCDWRFKG